jgi:hypothetical protein
MRGPPTIADDNEPHELVPGPGHFVTRWGVNRHENPPSPYETYWRWPGTSGRPTRTDCEILDGSRWLLTSSVRTFCAAGPIAV